jgi:alkanesulfonate monooxygenase SsuD/methylene tetrahydromethanopterin reductase-like flavin-dependent oxidoreductase (luciferase family)
MRRSVVFAFSGFRGLVELAQSAEQAGFFRAWMTEYPDRDALIRATATGCATSRLAVGTGIAYSFTRHPLALAAAVLDVHETTGGRFALGLGAGTQGMRRRWFGIDDERAVDRMREAVDVVRRAWQASGKFSYHGRYVDIEVDDLNLAERAAILPGIQVYGSGLNTAMVTAAAAWCDGIVLHPLAVGSSYWETVMSPLLAAREGAPPLRLAQWVVTAVDDDSARAEFLARRALAFYLATPSYRQQFAATPWADVPDRVIGRFKQLGPQWDILAAHVPEEMVTEYCLAGTPDAVRVQARQMEARLGARGTGEMVLQAAAVGLPEDQRMRAVQAAIQALGPLPGGEVVNA